jgi:hypothetical protein
LIIDFLAEGAIKKLMVSEQKLFRFIAMYDLKTTQLYFCID